MAKKPTSACNKLKAPEIDLSGRQRFGGKNLLKLFSPEVPFEGENSAADPAFLPLGIFQRGTNLRFFNRGLRVRDGHLKLTASVPTANASFRGCYSCYMDGAIRLFAAYRVSGATRVYQVGGLTTSNWTFTEITAGSGSAPDDESEATANVGTRLYTDGMVRFTTVRDALGPSPTELLVFGNGTDAPRVWGANRILFGSTNLLATTHGTVNPPTRELCWSLPDVTAFVNVRVAAATTIANSAGVATTQQGAATETYLEVTVTTSGGYSTITPTGATACSYHDGDQWNTQNPLQLTRGSQLWFVCTDNNTVPVWRYLKVLLKQGGTTETVYDASVSTFTDPVYYSLADGRYIVAFDLDNAQLTVTQPTEIRVECILTPDSAKTFTIDGIMVGGMVAGDSTYVVSHIHTQSRSESGGIECPVKDGALLGGPNGRGCALTRVGERVPPSGVLRVRHSITYPHSPKSLRVDYAMLYRKEAGETQAIFVQPMLCPRSAPAAYGNLSVFSDNAKSRTRYVNRPAPKGSNISTPYGSTFLSSGNRLFVGKGSELYISADKAPFRFSQVASITGAGASVNPAYHLFPGELVKGLKRVTGQLFGSSPVFVFTDQKVYRVDGSSAYTLSQATLASHVGCPYPETIGDFKTSIYFVGDDRQVWQMGYEGSQPLSLHQVDDRLASIDLTKSYGAASERAYYLTHLSGADTVPKDLLRYDSTINRWGSDRIGFADNLAGILKFQSGTEVKLIGFGDTGHIYQLEKPGQTTDDGTLIPITIKTGELNNGQWAQLSFGRVGMVADNVSAGATLTILRTCPASGDTATSIMKFDATPTGRLYRWDQKSGDSTQPSVAVDDLSCVVQITGSLPGGTRIHSIVLETTPRGEGADSAPA